MSLLENDTENDYERRLAREKKYLKRHVEIADKIQFPYDCFQLRYPVFGLKQLLQLREMSNATFKAFLVFIAMNSVADVIEYQYRTHYLEHGKIIFDTHFSYTEMPTTSCEMTDCFGSLQTDLVAHHFLISHMEEFEKEKEGLIRKILAPHNKSILEFL